MTTLEALNEAKATIGRLVAGIEQHHATSSCYDSGIWALANSEYKALDMLRCAITREQESQRRADISDIHGGDSCYGADPS